jgi:protein-S-isoprenylcysteine O-methyltransferase Ste14
MMRWFGLVIVVALLALGYVAYAYPRTFPNMDVASLVYAVMALLLVSGAGYGFWRFREHKAASVAGLVFWPIAIIAIAWAYETFR